VVNGLESGQNCFPLVFCPMLKIVELERPSKQAEPASMHSISIASSRLRHDLVWVLHMPSWHPPRPETKISLDLLLTPKCAVSLALRVSEASKKRSSGAVAHGSEGPQPIVASKAAQKGSRGRHSALSLPPAFQVGAGKC
jgi:hypothetical protein